MSVSYELLTEQVSAITAHPYGLLSLSILTLTIAMLLIWYLYRKIAKRDMFIIEFKKYTGRFVFFKKLTAFVSYIIKYVVLFPVYTFIMFIILSMSFFFLSSIESAETVLFFSLIIISVIRVLAYINEDAAQELAKMLPFALVLSLLLNPNITEYRMPDMSEIAAALPSITSFFVFIIGLEFCLRIFYLFCLGVGVVKQENAKHE